MSAQLDALPLYRRSALVAHTSPGASPLLLIFTVAIVLSPLVLLGAIWLVFIDADREGSHVL
jgi:hypothetical protein